MVGWEDEGLDGRQPMVRRWGIYTQELLEGATGEPGRLRRWVAICQLERTEKTWIGVG